jgi:hypothetical protein
VTGDFALNRFIFKRDRARGLAHALIMWGCIIAFAITFPLVFGWIHFETIPGDLQSYRTYVFGFPTNSFKVHSVVAFVIFHGLVWSAFLVIAGVMLAMRRRMREHGAAAVQRFGEDFLPLILLFAISITGLLLTASYTWMKGYGYDRLPGATSRCDRHLHAALAALRKVLSHLPASRAAWGELLQRRRLIRGAGEVPPL